jgi:uncharacterized DUF497 family protein
MSSLRIEAFLIDDENEGKFASHGLSVAQVLQVLDDVHLVIKNRKRRRGLYLIAGRDSGGRRISVPVERTRRAAVWRPITAWPCKPYERRLLEKRGTRHG